MKVLWAIFLVLMEYNSVLCYSVAQREIKPLPQQTTLTSEGGNTRNLNFLESTYDPGDETLNTMDYDEQYEVLKHLEKDIKEEQDIATKSAILMKMLEDPAMDTLPVIYVEESNDINPPLLDEEEEYDSMSAVSAPEKRSRYYRRYPWKRHSRNRGTYDPDIKYACTPSKDDVFKLLIGLHHNRNGNQRKTVNFCNRKRPAKAIFTNIRFLG
ncbi:hypothetical protein ACFFRR_004868 [Megaselia abdita]